MGLRVPVVGKWRMEIPGSRARVHAKFYGQGCRRKDSPVQPSRCCFCPVEARRANCVQAEEESKRVETINCVAKKTTPWADLFIYYLVHLFIYFG